MAAPQAEKTPSSDRDGAHMTDPSDEVCQGTKRTLNGDESPEPPQKSPRTLPPQSVSLGSGTGERPDRQTLKAYEDGVNETMQGLGPEEAPACSRWKSWRRSTRGRRSLPCISNTSQMLCKAISPSLAEEERLEELMKASMQLTVARVQNSLQTIPGVDLKLFQTQVDSLQKNWTKLAKDLSTENHCTSAVTSRDPCYQRVMEQMRMAVKRLQAEGSTWETLLNKHRLKAEELAKRVAQGQEMGLTLDPGCLSRSSQSSLILSKPDYHSLLCRQQRVLSTVELLMGSQCKMVRELLTFQEQSELLVREISARLATDAGFQNLPSSPVRKLLKAPLSTLSS